MGWNFINMDTKFTFLNDFEGQKNFKEDYKDNALLLYALQLRFDIEDIDAVAADVILFLSKEILGLQLLHKHIIRLIPIWMTRLKVIKQVI